MCGMGFPIPWLDHLAPSSFTKDGGEKPDPMITFLKKDHFEGIRTQIECKEHSKISLKDISDLTDIPKYKSMMSMSTHFQDFESYLAIHYGVEGFPQDNMVRPKLAHAYWHNLQP